MVRVRLTALTLGCAILAGCGGGSTMPAGPASVAGGTGTLAFSIAVPGRGSTSATKRLPKYVSASTTQAAVVVTPQSGAPTSTTVACTSVCSGSLTIAAGIADVKMTLEDGSGNALSQGTTPVLIIAGQTNNARFTLDGVVNSVGLQFVPGYVTTGSPQTVELLVNALDIDGNVITYNGAYVDVNDNQVVIKLTSTTPAANAALATYAVSAPGALIPVPYSGESSITVTPTVTSGSVPGPVTGATLRLLVQTIFAATHNGTVTVYSPRLTLSASIATGDVPQAMALDGAADLFVAQGTHSTISEYVPPYTGSSAVTISSGVSSPDALDIDSSGNLFVANEGANTVTIYAPPYSGAPKTTISTGVHAPAALVIDGLGNLYVVNAGSVTVYAPPYTGSPTVTITTGLSTPQSIALDGNGNLFVANGGNSTVTEYAPPYTGTPTTLSSDITSPVSLTVDELGDVLVSNCLPSNYLITGYFTPVSPLAPLEVANAGGICPSSVSVDIEGDIYSGGTVEYSNLGGASYFDPSIQGVSASLSLVESLSVNDDTGLAYSTGW